MARRPCFLLLVGAALGACSSGNPPPAEPLPLTPVRTDRTYLRDGHGRYVLFHGVNVSGSTKVAAFKEVDGKQVATFLEKPFPLEKADQELSKLRALGFDTIRLLLAWEAIQPDGPDTYDAEYLGYIREIVKKAGEHGLYVLMDMHQDMFSRHLRVKYNRHPAYGEPGSLENTLLALVPPFDDVVQGDGAPRWAVEACLPEKDLDSPRWGVPRITSGLTMEGIENLIALYKKLAGDDSTTNPELEEWMLYFVLNLPGEFPVNETSDLLPFTHWGVSHALSLDLARLYACFLAGDKAFPKLTLRGKNVKDYLQEAYANAWAQVAAQVGDLPNVIGYDVINEPGGNFIPLTAAAALIKGGGVEGARGALVAMLGEETGEQAFQALQALRILPPDTNPETLRLWGLEHLDVMGVASLNIAFDENYMRPLHERVGKAVLARDPDAVIWIEHAMSAAMFLGGSSFGGQWEQPMTRPRGLPQVVYAPHWYPDIYPFPGFNQPSRSFTVEEVRYRDYQPNLEAMRAHSVNALGNIPVVFGEFGTYFNFGGIEQARASGYAVSAHILDNYFEAFERMFQSRILWCYSPENDYELGDLWNHEDFSIIDPEQKPRGELAWARPHARFLAGKPVSTHFWSDYHYYDPDKGVPDPRREFEVRYASKETEAPSEIVVPEVQYPDGFYVWVSDGRCYFDPKTATLYHYPSRDEPGVEHWVRLLPPDPLRENDGWKYFFKGEQVVERN
ncbi:MAG: cellulase family glycosylhydrolase [Myxococcales bacterium]|jgi:hypothetical protein